jgi:hypothetical protein
MKKFLLVFFLFLNCSVITKAQAYTGNLYDFFDFHQPDARSEALGKTQVVLYGNPLSSYNNPASSSFSEGLNVEYSHLDPQLLFAIGAASYDAYGISYNSKKYGAIAFNAHYFSGATFGYSYPPFYDYIKHFSPTISDYSFNYSYMPVNNLSVGININYFREDKLISSMATAWSFDLGLLKKITFNNSTNTQNIFLGVDIFNVANNKIKFDSDQTSAYYINNGVMPGLQECPLKLTLPSNLRIGASYDYETKLQLAGFKIFKMMAATEYSDLINAKLFTTIKTGAEFTFLETLKLRIGYYNEKVFDDPTLWNKENLSEFTYGAGVNIPIQRVINSNFPVSLQFDYSSSKNTTFSALRKSDKRYSVFNLNLNVGI